MIAICCKVVHNELGSDPVDGNVARRRGSRPGSGSFNLPRCRLCSVHEADLDIVVAVPAPEARHMMTPNSPADLGCQIIRG